MSLKRKRALSPCSDYTLFTGAPTRGELQGWLDLGSSSHPPPPPLLWEQISNSITFPRRPSSPPPPVASIALASQTDSITSSSSQRSLRPPRAPTSQPQRSSSSLPPPPGPTPSPQKLTPTVAPTPSPGSSTGVAGSLGESMEVSGPPSGRKGTRNRGPEWTPILTPPSFEDPATKKKKAAVEAGRALVGKGAKGLLSLVAEEEGEAEAEGGGGREEEGREEKGDTTVATEISFLAPSPFFAPSRASRSREEEEEDDDDRGEEGPSRSRPSADFSLQDEFIDESTRPPPGYENVLTQPDASDVTRSRFEDPDETGSSLEESQIPMKRKGKGRGSVLALNPTSSRSTRSHSLLNNTSLAADPTATSAAAAGDESQDSFGSSYLLTQNDLPTQTTTAAPPLPYVHPKINTSHLTHLDSDDLIISSSSSSQLPSRINFLAVVLGVELDTIPAKDGRFWTLGKVKVHDGRKERVVQCWEEVAREWCDGGGGSSGRGRLRRLDVVWFQNIKPDLERSSKKRNETDPSVILKADFSPGGSPSSFEVFYRCSEFSPHDAPEDTVRWRVNLGRKDRGVEMVKKLVRLVEVGTFGS